jgi:diaminopimelate epimerase
MLLNFVKMHGLGNDFIVLDHRSGEPLLAAAQWRALADRHTGVGFDQALLIEAPRSAGARASYRVINADGGEVQQCGNGVRCVARLLHGRDPALGADMLLDSGAGPVRARILESGNVAIDMGVPDFAPAAMNMDVPAEALRYGLLVGGVTVEFGAVSIGNPHAVLTVTDVDSAPVATLGAQLESHPRFRERTNVGFMQIVDDAHIRLRVFERGVGETRACGTGACAAVAVGRRHGRLGAHVEVALPGGRLWIDWPGEGQSLWMTGPALESFRGQVEI